MKTRLKFQLFVAKMLKSIPKFPRKNLQIKILEVNSKM